MLYANKIRGLPFLLKPHKHLIAVLIGTAIGYKVHQFEETFEDRMRALLKAHPHAPIYPRETLKAYQTTITQQKEAELAGADEEEDEEDDFEIDEDEEDEEEDDE